MRRRLTLTVVMLVVGTLLVSSVVTLLLTVHASRRETRREITGEAVALASAVRAEAAGADGDLRGVRVRRVLQILKRPLKLEGSAVVTITAADTLRLRTLDGARQALPDGLSPADLDVAALAAGRAVSGNRGNVVFAAAPLTLTYRIGTQEQQAHEAVVLVLRAPSGLATAVPWLLVSSAGVLIVAVLVAERLVRRTVRPLRTAETVTARIAAGDLTARVTEEPGTDAELRNLGRSINTMAEALASAQGSQRQFLLSVSHELRTPLTSIRGFAEALEDGTATDVPRAAGIITAASLRLERLVSDLLELARLDTGQFSLRPGPVRLSAIVADAVAAFEPAAADLGLSLALVTAVESTAVEGTADLGPHGTAVDGSADLRPSPAQGTPVEGTAVDGTAELRPSPGLGTAADGTAVDVLADPDRLTQVISNLVENALSFASGTVQVGTATAGRWAILWVDDDGPGVSAQDLPSIFTRLFTSGARPGRRVGTGLGLAIVAELVASMGGLVRAESPLLPTGGTRLVVTLPLIDAGRGHRPAGPGH